MWYSQLIFDEGAFSGEGIVFKKPYWQNWISTYKRMDLDPYLKTQSRSKDPNIRATTITFLEENRRKAS